MLTGYLTFRCDPEPLYIQSGKDVPQPTEALQSLREHIIENHLDIVVIDPLSACALLQNENDNAAMNAVANSLRAMAKETKFAIILVHHTSKLGRQISGNHQVARGGSALGGASRYCLQVTEDPDDSYSLVLDISRNSYGKRTYGIMLARNPENGVVREITGAEIGRMKDTLMNSVVRFITDNPTLVINPKSVKNAGSESAQKLIDAVGAKPKEVYNAIMRAIKEGKLAKEERKKTSGSGTYNILVIPDSDDEFEDETEGLF